MKLTTLNGEWLEDHWGVFSGRIEPNSRIGRRRMPSLERATVRIDAMEEMLRRIAPHILFLCEAPVDPDDTAAFAARVLPNHRLVTRPAGQDHDVDGRQGMWFFVSEALWDDLEPELLDNTIWRVATHDQIGSFEDSGKWWTIRPKLMDFTEETGVSVNLRRTYGHSRHPQVLRFRYQGELAEIIGLHLKSKFTGSSVRRKRLDESFKTYASEPRVWKYLTEGHEARVKLTSQAMNVRAYIDHRFDQDTDPAIFVVGDINDGPGKELFEREFLLHDMISNLQGDVFLARRMLYHALFDLPNELRWTSIFDDKIDPARSNKILLDHILYTQAMNRTGGSRMRVEGGTGKVEHQHHDEVAAIFGKDAMADHRAVSVEIVPRT